MKTKLRLGVSIAALAVLGATAGLVRQGGPNRPVERAERKVAFYQDSMHPWVKSDRPGKCTICDMDLTPIYEGQAGFGGDNIVVIGSNQITVLSVQTEPVKRQSLGRRLRVAGTLEANETRKTVVSAPARGRIDALAVDYAGVEVQEGQKLITLFSPELVQLRKTLLAVRGATQPGATNSLTKALVDSGIYTGDILAPQSGMVLERNVYNGQYVAEGDRLMTIADASTLWFRFDVYQDQLPWFEVGAPLDVEVPGIPGKVFPAVISFVEPAFNDATRTVKVRADIRNPVVEVNGHKQRLLKYGMYAEGRARAEVTNVLAIARTAIVSPGGGAYAYVEKGDGAYERRRLKLGRQGDACWEVLKGVEEGESVVTSGNLLIDAQAQFSQTSIAEGAAAEEVGMVEATASQAARPEPPPHVVTAGAMTEVGAANEPSRPVLAAMGSSPIVRPVAREHGAARRTQLMSAVMSPGAELQMKRRATIIAELDAKAATNATGLAEDEHLTGPDSTTTDEHGKMQVAMAETPGQTPAGETPSATVPQTQGESPGAPLISQLNYQQVQSLLLAADAISGALAADNLDQFKAQAARLPALLAPVQKDLAPQLHWEASLLEPLAALSKGEPPKDLEQARKRFLPFSTGVVAFTRQVKRDLVGFPAVKIYHCPMAPEPGLWMQAQAPLRNPFFGSKMLRCGEEVK